MIRVDIPGVETLSLSYLVLDYNGTIALDGSLLNGVADRLKILADSLNITVLTADTHSSVRGNLATVPCSLHIIGPGSQDKQKEAYVRSVNPAGVVALGNGRNDSLMLAAATLGIGLIQEEGASLAALLSARLVCSSVNNALDLLLKPDRLRATLRN